ncbi:peptidase family M20/M25/M40 protein [Aspergillus mulundensis]|uniref:PH domain-containing protein n=1 Tax=Aspergillus mulundensis TaxID=1810919 RepID=A0A3D8SVN8_9EURO|nr:hypothetical protein DSM5745_02158 [Aspergillus mulundensis]RDW90383.1 hypothetical protein DSM5745_02158 [Aspergillus mulundensis]
MSLNTKPPQPSVSERRGHQLAPLHLQTNFSRPNSQIVNVASPLKQRPRPSDYENGKTERVPLQSAHVKRQSSRSSLRHIFSREKHGRKSDARLSGIEEVQDPVSQASTDEEAPLSPTPDDCDTPRAVPVSAVPAAATTSSSATPPRSKLQSKQRSKTVEEDNTPVEDVAWKPPPLFKAYPQGLKHATLASPILSSDSIMRLHATFKAREANLRDNDQQASQPANEEPVEEPTARKKKLDKEKQKYLRALSENVENGEWTQRIYVIATSGYILQYPGDGKHDRLPEKMLLLGPKSVAFASDAIPGKHWVLQVSQGTEEDSGANSAETARPLLSRFGFHRSHARRLARNLLLVFSDPEEMSSWLLAVRAQIEARGGKKYVSEKVYDEGMETQLRTTPSMRQMVKRDPNRFSAVYLQPRQSMVFEDKESSAGEQSRRSSYISLHRRSIVISQPPESRAGSVSTAHTDDEPARFYAAVGSPPLPDGSVISESASAVTAPTSPTSTTPKKRQSMFLPPASNPKAAEIPRAQSTVPDAHFRSASPPAPNFSVPLFSRRFAARQDTHQASRDNRDDISIDTISMFSSPPQSPSREGFSVSMASPEQRRPADRRDQAKKPLRASNSEDALVNTSRERDRSRVRYSHLPEHIAMLPSNCPSTSPRRLSVKPVMPSPSLPMPLAEVVNSPGHCDQSSKADTSSRPSSIVTSRRKSLTGLTVGPPAAPPPNIPLPKIPSGFVDSPPQTAWSEKSLPLPPVEDVEQTPDSITPLPSTHSHLPRTVRSRVSRHMGHANKI